LIFLDRGARDLFISVLEIEKFHWFDVCLRKRECCVSSRSLKKTSFHWRSQAELVEKRRAVKNWVTKKTVAECFLWGGYSYTREDALLGLG
jgi:hypothetical protein